MTFIDDLRMARSGRTAVLHEFLLRYDPKQRKLHAFFEGYEDIPFYSGLIEQRLPQGDRLVTYRCGGKREVYELFHSVVQRYPKIKEALFFVDKDLDDILGEPWPTDPRIFVTDTYSIENYLVSTEVFARLCRDSLQMKRVEFPAERMVAQFERQLAMFQRLAIPLMAWIVAVRRSGQRPVLNDVNMGELFGVSIDCCVCVKSHGRLRYLARVTGVLKAPGGLRQFLQIARELKRIPAKRIVRGKFEAWFFVEFWKSLIAQMRALAKEAGGDVAVSVQLERSNFVHILAGRMVVPECLERFLALHLGISETSTEPLRGAARRGPVARRILSVLRILGLHKED
jgi:hypothetical protein